MVERKALNELERQLIEAEEDFLYDVQFGLQWLMREKGMTKAKLATELGVSRARVSQMFSESGNNLTLRTVGRIFRLLGETCHVSSPCLDALKAKAWADITPECSSSVEGYSIICRERQAGLERSVYSGSDVPDNHGLSDKLEKVA